MNSSTKKTIFLAALLCFSVTTFFVIAGTVSATTACTAANVQEGYTLVEGSCTAGGVCQCEPATSSLSMGRHDGRVS